MNLSHESSAPRQKPCQEEQHIALASDDRLATLQRSDQKLKLIMSWVVVVVLTAFGVLALIGLFTVGKTEGVFWRDQIRENFPVIIGLPMAGLGALFVSLVLQISSGPIEFEAVGIKFKGGSAPIVFWLLCFLAIAVAMKML